MKFGWLVMLGAGLAVAGPASAQVSVYADISASKLTNPNGSAFTYGPTFGVQAQLGKAFHTKFDGDLRGFYYAGGNLFKGTGTQTLAGASVGPKLAFQVKRVEPYAEFLVGFARYNDGNGQTASGTTDVQLEVNFGADYRVTERFDWRVFEFGYKQFYALGGQFNPKTFSTGVVLHLGKRS